MLRRQSYDVVVAGAGIIGLHAAKQVAERLPGASILVVDKASGVGTGSSGYSSAVLRCRYSFLTMTKMAVQGLSTHRNWNDYVGQKISEPRFVQHDILWIVPGQTWKSDTDLLNHLGVKATAATTASVKDLYPALEVDDLEADETHLIEHSAGYFNPSGALLDLANWVHAYDDGELAFKKQVKDITTSACGSQVTHVCFDSGDQVSCGAFIDCSGPWAGRLPPTATLAKQWNIAPVRIQALHKPIKPDDLYLYDVPIVCDVPNGIYFRPDLSQQHIVVSTVLPEEEKEVVAPDDFNTAADPEVRTRFLSGLHSRLPSLPARGAVRSYAALYTMNQRDGHPIIGRHETLDNYFLAHAFTGHGFKLSPVVGDMLAYQLTNLTSAEGASQQQLDEFSAFLNPYRKPIWNQVSVVA